jgi:serine/threonine-protein kinase HipA
VSRILTYVEIDGQTLPAGDAYFNFRRGRLTATFSYERDYIASPGAYAVDPALGLMTGSWPLPHGLPGAFSDAAPDRWGRNLIARRIRGEAGAEGRPAPTLDDRDYLLGVSDETRQGALRFKTDAGDEFQHPAPDVPKLIALPSLLRAANAASRDEPDSLATTLNSPKSSPSTAPQPLTTSASYGDASRSP